MIGKSYNVEVPQNLSVENRIQPYVLTVGNAHPTSAILELSDGEFQIYNHN
jgi:hypothetical protein